jgi:hypothetical protein
MQVVTVMVITEIKYTLYYIHPFSFLSLSKVGVSDVISVDQDRRRNQGWLERQRR